MAQKGELTINYNIVYIASPYAGDVETNTQFAKEAMLYTIHQGFTPVAPHLLYPQILDDLDPADRELGLSLGRSLLCVADQLWVCGDTISEGMEREIELAEKFSIPVSYVSTELICVSAAQTIGSQC